MDKIDFTKLVIEEAELQIDLKEALENWWYPHLNHNIFRLKRPGYQAFKKITPEFKFKSNFHPCGKIYKMFSKLNCPYFIHFESRNVSVHIFSTKIATVIGLYGNIDDYLKTL